MMIGEVLLIEDPRQLLSDLIVAVRKVRDQRGDDRCHMDLTALYQLLPEGDTRPKEDTLLTLENCARYIAATLDPNIAYVSPQRRIEELEALIGQAPAGSHPDEWKPRAATWHEERQNWMTELEALRAEVVRLSESPRQKVGEPMSKSETFAGYAIIELMGHRRIAGLAREATIAGASMLRVDIPGPDGNTAVTQFVSPASIYCLTPCGEKEARAVAQHNMPQPVQRWEIPQLAPARDIVDADYTPISPEESEDSPERHWDANEFEADTKENPY